MGAPVSALAVTRIVDAVRSASTRALVVEAGGARWILKLVNGPEGPSSLAAEWLVTRLASAVGFTTLELGVLELDARLVPSDMEWELREQIERGAGTCLGTRELRGARIARDAELAAATDDFAIPLLWLDVLVENPDRRSANPNVLRRQDGVLVPMDHASSLPFHHGWTLDENAPASSLAPPPDHLYGGRAEGLVDWHGELGARLTRSLLADLVLSIPDAWLAPLAFPTIARQREAYVAYLWKRLRALDAAFLRRV